MFIRQILQNLCDGVLRPSRSIAIVAALTCAICVPFSTAAKAQTHLSTETLWMLEESSDAEQSVRRGRLPLKSSLSRDLTWPSETAISRWSAQKPDARSQHDIGDTLSFNTPLPLSNGWRSVNFTLEEERTSIRIWIETSFVADVSQQQVDSLASYLLDVTPNKSVDPTVGILTNNGNVFGDVPSFDGDDVLDILWLDILDDYDPGLRGFVPGLVAPEDYDTTSADGRGNRRDILYLDLKPQLISDFGSVRAVSATSAGVHQALTHLYYDSDESVLLSVGLQEFARTINGFEPLAVDYLEFPIEHNIGLLSWEGFVGDAQRGSLFIHYLADRVGIDSVAALTRNADSDVASLVTLATNAGYTLEELVIDFHTANFVNDRTIQNKWGYTAERYATLPTKPTSTLDASQGSSINTVTNTLAPGAVQMLQWLNVRDLSVTLDATTAGQRASLRARAILQNIDGTLTTQELSIDDQPDLLQGSFDAATIILSQVALGEPSTQFALRGDWAGTAHVTVNQIFDTGRLYSGGTHFFQLGPEWTQAVRFRRPATADFSKLFIDPFFLNELADASGTIQGSPSDPRDLLIEFHRDDGGFPGDVFFSLEIRDEGNYQPVVSDLLRFTTIDVAIYPELRVDDLIIYVSIKDVGADANHLVMGVSTYETENTSFLFGPFPSGTHWLGLWDVVAGVQLTNRSIPIRAQFREGLPTGIENGSEVNVESNLSAVAFPNPAAHQFIVEVTADKAQATEITVVDLLGRVVSNTAHPFLAEGLHQITYDVSDWASGVYLIRIVGVDGQTAATRAIVAH